ncbi:hypothetical protein BB561_006868, partial [Smittium simulii]
MQDKELFEALRTKKCNKEKCIVEILTDRAFRNGKVDFIWRSLIDSIVKSHNTFCLKQSSTSGACEEKGKSVLEAYSTFFNISQLNYTGGGGFKGRLPKRFTGNQSTTIYVNTWINKFKLFGEIKSWDETTQLKILELWLEGKAYEWFSLFKQKNEKLSIKTALLGLATEYSNKHSGSLKDLMEIKVLPEETVLEFNKRFLDNWSTIPVSHYTEEIVRDTYLSKLSDLDRKVWWNLIPTAENKTTKTLIQESDSYARVKTKYSNTANKKPENISKLDKKYNRIAKSSKENDPMDELTQSIKELILLKLFKLKPELIKNMQEEIRYLGLPSKKNYMLYNKNPIDEEPKTYIVSTILKRKIPVFVDTGSMSSIIDYRILDTLGISPK